MLLHATLLCCVACSSTTADVKPSDAVHSSLASASPTQTSTPAAIKAAVTYSTDHAAPVNSTTLTPALTLPAGRPGRVTVGALGLTPDGAMLAVVNRQAVVSNGQIKLEQSRLELLGPHGGSTRIAGRPGRSPKQAVFGDADNDYLVWMETPSTSLMEQPWSLLVADRRAGSTRVLAESPAAGVPAPPGGTVPFLASGRVYWAAAERTTDGERPARAHVYSRDVRGVGPVRREVADAMLPSASGRSLFYVVSDFVDPRMPPGQVEIHRKNLGSGADTVVRRFALTQDQTLAGLTSHDDTVAWIINTAPSGAGTNDGSGAVLYLLDATGVVTAVSGEQLAFGTPVLTERFVAWTEAGQAGREWVFDRTRKQILLLGEAPGVAAVYGAGDQILWRDGPSWRGGRLKPTAS